jgi:uncharacterized protein (DUF1697 family)
MSVFIALLRAVNVSGTGKLPMAELKAACGEAGLERVETYIASGNLVFESALSAVSVKALIAGVLRDRFGLAANDPLIRTPAALAAAIEGNPFADAAAARPNLLQLTFLESAPDAVAMAALAAYQGPERLHLAGDHLYVDFAEGIARSKLTPAFLAKALRAPATGRNWNTANKLLALAQRRDLLPGC